MVNSVDQQEEASILCEDLEQMFREETKVLKDTVLTRSYADWALREGYAIKDIQTAFGLALESCHVDATDERLRRNDQSYKYELTSTIYRAKERLKQKYEKTPNNKTIMKNENQEKPRFKRNPEIDEKLNTYMKENPNLVDFYNNMEKSELVRKACLQSMKRDEWKKRQELHNANNHSIENTKAIKIAM